MTQLVPVKIGAPNELRIRVVGQSVCATINGVAVAKDQEFDLNPTGSLGFSLHNGEIAEIRILEFTDLSTRIMRHSSTAKT